MSEMQTFVIFINTSFFLALFGKTVTKQGPVAVASLIPVEFGSAFA